MQSKPQVMTEPAEIFDAVRQAKAARRRVGLVPTMGALHAGHLSLVEKSRAACDVTIVTIFVNPTQFGPGEDYGEYPRTLNADAEKLAPAGADYVFAPRGDAIYRPGHSTYVEPPQVARLLEGQQRPGHFRGVTTVVLKLFHLIPADIAFFGQKDYQQSLVIRRMAADLDVPIEIRICPTIREADGLAMSSRNAYLSSDQRRQALAISEALHKARALRAAGEKQASSILDAMRTILVQSGIEEIDYMALADPQTLENRDQLDEPAIALIAAHVGQTRLIDNLRIE